MCIASCSQLNIYVRHSFFDVFEEKMEMQQQKAKEMREREFAELKERSQKSLEMQAITMTVHCISTIGEWSDPT